MPKVWNWQINREMDFPYEESRPKRQFAAVFDTNKCIACQTCTIACKTTWTSGRGQEHMFWNNVETKPYGFYPLGWDVRLMKLLGFHQWEGETYGGETVFESAPQGTQANGYLPEDQDWAHPNIGEDEPCGSVEQGQAFGTPHDVWNFYLPRICNHCTYAACIAACPRGAIYKREEDGVVLIDQERCRGYGECMKACPYKKVLPNSVTRTSEKCIGCYPLIEQGYQTRCVTTCIGRIRLNGWISPPDQADPEKPMDYIVHVKKLALPLYPQAGLEPNIYYIPPVHVPGRYLKQMFGPGYKEAVEVYETLEEDQQLLGCLTLFGSTDKWIDRFRVAGGYAYGYSEDGRELVRSPLREPSEIRPFYDEKHQAYRHNTP